MLKKDDITLRAPEPQDVDFLFGMENDPALWYVSQTLVPYSRFDLEQYVFSTGKQEPFAAGQVRFMIEWNPETPVTVGTIDLFALDAPNRRAGVGIAMLEKYQGRSLAGKALDVLVDYAFNFLNLHQLYCNIEKGNEKSMQLFLGRGFEVVGTKKEWNLKGGEWKDEIMLQLVSEK